MTTALYRVSSGEVIEISLTDSNFSEYLDGFHAALADPILVDGSDVQSPNGDYRVLGYAKINDNGTVRNATQQEIDTFAIAQSDDLKQLNANRAKDYFKNNSQFRMVMIAILKPIISEFNTLRALHGLPDRTLAQLKNTILNSFDKDD